MKRILVLCLLGWVFISCRANARKETTTLVTKNADHSLGHEGSGSGDKPSNAHVHTKKSAHHAYKSLLHKKEELLGQDTMRINDAEFQLQSLVSPEFHQAREALRGGRPFKGLEINAMTPEQVAFIQGTSQWPKYFRPLPSSPPTRSIFPENPILFPGEIQSHFHGNRGSNNGNKQQGRQDVGDVNMLDMEGPSFSSVYDKANRMSRMRQDVGMETEERPGLDTPDISFIRNRNGGIDDALIGGPKSIVGETTSTSAPLHRNVEEEDVEGLPGGVLSGPKGFVAKYNTPLGKVVSTKTLDEDLAMASSTIYGQPSKSAFSSLYDDELPSGRGIGKPVGILRNILKASRMMPDPTSSLHHPSQRRWLDNGPFTRREKLGKKGKSRKLVMHPKHSSQGKKYDEGIKRRQI